MIKGMVLKALSIYREKRRINSAVKQAKQMANVQSYFPELEQKSIKQKEKENIKWARKYGEVNSYYTLYGFDIVGLRNQDEYIDYYSFMISRNRVNRLDDWWSYVAILRDKYVFFKFMKSSNIPVPDVFGIINDGELYDSSMNSVQWDTIKDETDYFIKIIDGECASYVKHIGDYNDLCSEKINKIYKRGRYILQRSIKQYEGMNALNPYAINTLRIVTINKNGNPYVLTSLLRVGTSKTGNVDNWAAGGLAVGIEEGHLKKYGFYKPNHGTKTDKHPDTGVVFSSFEIPMYEEAVQLACKAYKCLYGIRAIGWDIAISTEGPIIVEGNDNFEISLQQACDRPLRQEWGGGYVISILMNTCPVIML